MSSFLFFSPTLLVVGCDSQAPPAPAWHNKIMINTSKLATHIHEEREFALTAVSFATSTLETSVVAVWMVWTELAPVPVVSCILLLHTVPWSSEDWGSCSLSGICGRRDRLLQPEGEFPKVLGLQSHFLFARELLNNWVPQTAQMSIWNKCSYSAVLCAHTQSPKQQLITQRKKDAPALQFSFFLLDTSPPPSSFYCPLCCDGNRVTLEVSESFLTYKYPNLLIQTSLSMPCWTAGIRM